MSVGGQYALACAAQHPERVTSAAVVAAPAVVPDLDPPWHRDDLDESGQQFVRSLAEGSPAENAERMRPDFERYCDDLALEEADTEVARRWLDGLPAEDAALLGGQSPAEVAAGAREALAEPRGYLRDAAIAFCRWDFSLDTVTCPVTLWYGERDANAPVRNGVWLAEHLPNARLRVLAGTGHLEALHGHWPEILADLAD
jgi:pimeloyl-ACP methyl ester carboxylesterase